MSYDRCTEHKLMRCPICMPRTEGARPSVTGVATVGLIPAGWSPEDALDSGQAPPPGVIAAPQQPDKQTLEAIERQKPAAIEVDFGDDKPASIVVEPIISMANKAIVETIMQPEPFFTPEKTSANPVVAAAQAYAQAEDAFMRAGCRVVELTGELEDAQEHLKRMAIDRDTKKLALKSQVE